MAFNGPAKHLQQAARVFKCVCVSIYAGVKEGLLSVLSTERES